jgi:hypothetical protein
MRPIVVDEFEKCAKREKASDELIRKEVREVLRETVDWFLW